MPNHQPTASIANAATSAVGALEALLASRDEWVRLKAAAKILDTAIDYNQEALITDRIAALGSTGEGVEGGTVKGDILKRIEQLRGLGRSPR